MTHDPKSDSYPGFDGSAKTSSVHPDMTHKGVWLKMNIPDTQNPRKFPDKDCLSNYAFRLIWVHVMHEEEIIEIFLWKKFGMTSPWNGVLLARDLVWITLKALVSFLTIIENRLVGHPNPFGKRFDSSGWISRVVMEVRPHLDLATFTPRKVFLWPGLLCRGMSVCVLVY